MQSFRRASIAAQTIKSAESIAITTMTCSGNGDPLGASLVDVASSTGASSGEDPAPRPDTFAATLKTPARTASTIVVDLVVDELEVAELVAAEVAQLMTVVVELVVGKTVVEEVFKLMTIVDATVVDEFVKLVTVIDETLAEEADVEVVVLHIGSSGTRTPALNATPPVQELVMLISV